MTLAFAHCHLSIQSASLIRTPLIRSLTVFELISGYGKDAVILKS